MSPAFTAFGRAVRSLAQAAVLWHLVWPALAAIAVWGVAAWLFWADASAWLLGVFESWGWLKSAMDSTAFVAGAAAAGAHVFLAVLMLPLIYATTLMLVALVALPLMLQQVAQREYAQLERRRGGTLAGSAGNALWALAVYLVGLTLTLPLWLIPGVGLALILFWNGYLNQRAYRYDALMEHADRAELRRIVAQERGGLWLAGLGTAALAYVPVVNFFAPAFAGLVFVHYCLQALQRLRAAKG